MKETYIRRWLDLYNEQMLVRCQKREKMTAEGSDPYKEAIRPNVQSSTLQERYRNYSKAELEAISEKPLYSVAGRAMLIRDFGKAAFVQLDDGSERIQVYVRKGHVSEKGHKEYKYLDYGDIFYAEGTIFRTDKGELSLMASEFQVLTKSLRPLPEKFHGLSDPELKYRLRYVDMAIDPDVRKTMKQRSQIIHYIRDFFYQKDFLEVETPMLHSVVGGAAAKPFSTHHNALSMDMVLRIAPELHLKRLIVGGLQRVFEMNRCFRNEGLSLKHNPEFTSIEFYQAYATYEDFMTLTEVLLNGLCEKIHQQDSLVFGDKTISFQTPFKRMTMREAVSLHTGLTLEQTYQADALRSVLKKGRIDGLKWNQLSVDGLMVLCFEEFAESQLINPTFITEFPVEISPLAKRNSLRPDVVDRFELFINGWEIANSFSELNNPLDQLERFAEQAVKKDQGDEEACDVDYDYVRALEYGMPPTAGEGIGIDRLCMLMTNSHSIRDVILFPQLKKEHFFSDGPTESHA